MAKLSSELRNKLRNKIIKYLNTLDEIDQHISDNKLFGYYSGLRLTATGNTIMKSVFDHYVFPLEKPLTMKEKIAINNNLLCCFYIGTNNIVIYDKQESTSIALVGDISLWIKSLD